MKKLSANRHGPQIVVRLALALAVLALNLSAAREAKAVSFSTTGALRGPRAGHTATLLGDGTVLVVGGYDGTGPGRLASAELYSPDAGTWAGTGALTIGRTVHSATLLSNGLVLVAGGHTGASASTFTCERYDPTTGIWGATGAMATGRGAHTATLLPNGKVLIAGGFNRVGAYTVASAELYDPATQTWTAAGAMAVPRNSHTATLLLTGKVLVAGGAPDAAAFSSIASAELYDPVAGTWMATGSMISARQYHTATLLPDGRVLVAGGASDGYFTSSAEIYDPASGRWTGSGSLGVARGIHTATLLPDGTVLAAGGNHNSPIDPLVTQSSAELYHPASGQWTATGPLNAAHTTHTATLLPSGKVLIAAGYNYNASVWLTSAELYGSAAGPITVVNAVKPPDGAFQFAFTGAPHRTNTVLATTDPTRSMSNWTALGVAPEVSPGLFLFSDREASNSPQRFYRVRSP